MSFVKAEDTTVSYDGHILWYAKNRGWSLLDGQSGETIDHFGSTRPEPLVLDSVIRAWEVTA